MNTQSVSDFLQRGAETGGGGIRTEFRANWPMLAALTAVAFITAAPATAKAAERDPQLVECEAEWKKIALEGQQEGDEKKVADVSKQKLACAKIIEDLDHAEKILTDATYRSGYANKLETDSRKIISYLKGESSISTQEMQRILAEYEYTVDKLLKYLDLNRPEDKEIFLFHKKLIEQARKKIG